MKNSRISRLVKHAERFGVDGVMDAALEFEGVTPLSFDDLVELQTELWRIEDEHNARGKRFYKPPKRKLTAETVVKRLLGIEDEEEAA